MYYKWLFWQAEITFKTSAEANYYCLLLINYFNTCNMMRAMVNDALLYGTSFLKDDTPINIEDLYLKDK